MSRENVELVLKDLEYWNRGDMEAFVGLWDDDVVLRAAEGWPERVFRGKDAVRSFYEGFAETVGRDSVIEDLIDAGDVVVTRMRAHMTGVQSGLEGICGSPRSRRSERARSCWQSSSGITRKLSKPPGCRSRAPASGKSPAPRSLEPAPPLTVPTAPRKINRSRLIKPAARGTPHSSLPSEAASHREG
jgi:hypothetical protein